MEETCIYEADFEFVEETPITLDLELKQYFDGSAYVLREFILEESDWTFDETLQEYIATITREIHGFGILTVQGILLWDETFNRYIPSLCDYDVSKVYLNETVHVDTIVKLFSEEPVKCKVCLFGQVLDDV